MVMIKNLYNMTNLPGWLNSPQYMMVKRTIYATHSFILFLTTAFTCSFDDQEIAKELKDRIWKNGMGKR